MNIESILKEIAKDLFRPSISEKALRNKIRAEIELMPDKPNENDRVILANALTYHHLKNNVKFVTVDSVFKTMGYDWLKKKIIGEQQLMLDCPEIESIR